ncbi:EutN/CcmL family microcompartment protein [candidate division KSB1 bacterium]|nr:EutN/CcmL family microcompartment protein [candidate division KSB1 bacterium]
MLICRIVGNIVSTHKNAHLQGHKLLLVQPVELDQKTPKGNSMIAIDRVNAGKDDLVLVNKEGSSARLILGDDENPVQAVIVGVIDGIDVPNQD